MKNVLLILLYLFSGYSIAQEYQKPVENFLEFTAVEAEGNEFRAKVREAVRLVKQNEYGKATEIIDKVLASFNQLFKPSQKQFSFQSDREYLDFVKNNGNKFQRIDWAYKMALQLKVFIFAAKNSFNEALVEIDKIENIAPVSASTKIEKGYILVKIRKFELAYKSYLSAIVLTDKYQSQYIFKPAALRGAGVVLIDLKRFDEAELKLRESLELEPENSNALHELKYINYLRKKKN